MVELMMKLMPYMVPLIIAGIAIAVIGLLMSLSKVIFNKGIQSIVTWSMGIVLGISVFFIAAQLMGMVLGFSPSINLGDAAKFEFNLVPFWLISIGFFVAAIVLFGLRRVGNNKMA